MTFLNKKQVAEQLGCSESWVDKMTKAGKLPSAFSAYRLDDHERDRNNLAIDSRWTTGRAGASARPAAISATTIDAASRSRADGHEQMTDQEKFEIDAMLGSKTRVHLGIYGPLDRHVMIRLADLVALLERSLLDQDEDEIEIEEHTQDVKARKRRQSRFIPRDCEYHPGGERNAANSCIQCSKENGLRNKALFARKAETIWSRPMKCPKCDAPNVRVYARANFDRDVDAWFHYVDGMRVPCVLPMIDYRSIPTDREYSAKEKALDDLEAPVKQDLAIARGNGVPQ